MWADRRIGVGHAGAFVWELCDRCVVTALPHTPHVSISRIRPSPPDFEQSLRRYTETPIRPYAHTPIRPYAHTFLQGGWHDWRYKAHPNASDEQIYSPVYEAIRDYWIDSRLGPGYSPH